MRNVGCGGQIGQRRLHRYTTSNHSRCRRRQDPMIRCDRRCRRRLCAEERAAQREPPTCSVLVNLLYGVCVCVCCVQVISSEVREVSDACTGQPGRVMSVIGFQGRPRRRRDQRRLFEVSSKQLLTRPKIGRYLGKVRKEELNAEKEIRVEKRESSYLRVPPLP